MSRPELCARCGNLFDPAGSPEVLCPPCRPQFIGSAVAPSAPTPSPLALVEGRDYYLDGGFMVFTADYLKRRGYCCESGCRHCPY